MIKHLSEGNAKAPGILSFIDSLNINRYTTFITNIAYEVQNPVDFIK